MYLNVENGLFDTIYEKILTNYVPEVIFDGDDASDDGPWN